MPVASSKFDLSIAIDEISKLTELVCHSEEHLNMFWIITARKKDGLFLVEIECDRPGQKTAWSVNVGYKIYLTSGKKSTMPWKDGSTVFSKAKPIDKNIVKSENLEEFVSAHVVNDSVTIRFEFEISNPTGFLLPQWDFSVPDSPHLSDVVLKIGNQTFHVSKMLLANFSSYFHAMFSEQFKESKKKEIELKEVSPAHFQALLDVIYHKSDVSILNVRDLLELVNYFDTPDVKRKCEELLLGVADTVVSKSEKLFLADKFVLSKLLEKCLNGLTSVSDVCSVTPTNVRELSEGTIAELLQKVININKSTLVQR